MIRAAAVRDVVALMTGVLADPGPDVDQALDHILEDLTEAEDADAIAVFVGLTSHLLNELALATGEVRDDLWQAKAAHITESLTCKEN